MHGACQTGLALSHNHTCIQALYHIYEHSLGALQLAGMGGNLNEHFNQKCCYDVRQTAGFPPLLPQELIVCFEVKVHNSITKAPSGAFTLGLHWCCNIVALLSVLYSEALG